VALREVEDWGFDAEKSVPPPLPPDVIEVEVAPRAIPPARVPSKDRIAAAALFVFVFALELVWLALLGSWIVRSVS
jgi:hypothetical protein